jgi:hypothetical protein
VARKAAEFLFVRACDKKTQEAVRSRGPGELVFVDPDGTELHRAVCTDAPAIEKAMDAALEKYPHKSISWNVYESQALESARAGRKLALIAFDDGGKEGEGLCKALEDRMVARLHDSYMFIRIPFQKDSEEARGWAVTAAPTLLVVDPSPGTDSKAVVKRITGKKTPAQLKALLPKSAKASEKPAR